MICSCKFDYNAGVGLGICKQCGGETCTKYGGCFISMKGHTCNNARYRH
jgi:hypothetical protein